MTEAARSEGRKKVLDFRGLKLKLPAKAPGSIVFDFAQLEEGQNMIAPVVGLIRTMLGEEQLEQVKAKIGADDVSLDDMPDVLMGLVNDILDKYGLTAGK